MKSREITKNLYELIADRKVKSAIFTTYNLETDFFELEVVPVLLPKGDAFSLDSGIKRFDVRERLKSSEIEIEVFYDQPIARQSKDGLPSPQMGYLCHGINRGNNAFHGKLNLILLEEETGESLLFGVGSNNLTYAGWWQNIECQYWLEISPENCHKSLLATLQQDFKYLEQNRQIEDNGRLSSFKRINSFLENCKPQDTSQELYYYGLSPGGNGVSSFIDFLTQDQSPLNRHSDWCLEIVSPFFADDPNSKLHEAFLKKVGVSNVRLLLPLDADQVALCSQKYYENVNSFERLEWSQWHASKNNELGLKDKDQFRNLHAKIYHFYRQDEAWIFVGSVNFTHKAIYENAEAGFLVKLPESKPLLDTKDTLQLDFMEVLENEPGIEEVIGCKEPDIWLHYDWISQKLVGKGQAKQLLINILSPEGKQIIPPWTLTNNCSSYDLNKDQIAAFERQIKNSALVNVSHLSCEEECEGHLIAVQQTGWSHKKIELPPMTLAQILAIYGRIGIQYEGEGSSEFRQRIMVEAQTQWLLKNNLAGGMTPLIDTTSNLQIFSEYAQIFNAFSQLHKRLVLAIKAEKYDFVDLYLTGAALDSLPSIVDRIKDISGDEELKIDAVNRYLILLSIRQILEDEFFKTRCRVQELLNLVNQDLVKLKTNDSIKLSGELDGRKSEFFDWFETQFKTPVIKHDNKDIESE